MPSMIPRLLAYILAISGLSFLLPMAAALLCGELSVVPAFAAPMAASGIVGGTVWLRCRRTAGAIGVEHAFMVVGFAWVAISLLGAIPLRLSGAAPSVVDAVFESVSGFTTTGATAIPDVESLPRCINLWRCETQWLGGMGVIALAVALLPLLGVGGFRLIKAETTGPEKSKLTARVANTAKMLWFMYCALTAMQTVALHLAGMSWFDAACHALSTLGTGGFSTRNAGIGAFDIPAVEWICTAFMLLASVNFALFYHLLHGRLREFFRNSELRAFAGVVLVATALVAAFQFRLDAASDESIRSAAFQVAAFVSTTGFEKNDYLSWTPAAQMILMALLFVGGCSGSTAGGVKVIRWTVLAKQLVNEFHRLLHPHGVYTLRINGVPGREEIVPVVASFVFCYVLLVFITAVVGALGGLDLVSAFTGSLAMVGNVGVAFGRLGVAANYAGLPDFVKAWYCLAMLAGRLEIYTLVILIGRLVRVR